MVHCVSLRWFRVSYLHGSSARESRMSLCVQSAANCATITGNSSPEVMMIMDFAANDFGWAALLASSADSEAIFMNKKRWKKGFSLSLSLSWLDQIRSTCWTWCGYRDDGECSGTVMMTNSLNACISLSFMVQQYIHKLLYDRSVFFHYETMKWRSVLVSYKHLLNRSAISHLNRLQPHFKCIFSPMFAHLNLKIYK